MPSPSTVVERRTSLPVPAEEAFAWHTRPGALERLAPPWERVEVVERHGGVENGGRTVLRIGVGPASVRWVAVHRDFEAGLQFADEQAEGPFAYWRHLHRFEPAATGACVAIDRVEYTPPLGALGAAVARLVARPRVERMLAYRHRVLPADLTAHARFRDRPRLHVAITGASGLLGSALTAFLTTGGHRVTAISRGARPGAVSWDPEAGKLDPAALAGVDAVIHLAGETIATRWTPARKRRIRESRLAGTRLLAETLARLPRPPRVLVSASGIGAYGNRGDETLTEATSTRDAPPDFFVELAREWEAATEPARAGGIRVVIPRLGVVLTPAGGALQRMLPPFRLGVGGPIGSGRQWLSWVAMDDALGAVHHALMSEELTGPVNIAAPQPVRWREFATTLGRVLRRPAVLPVPAAALRLAFGEMADVALLASQRVLPARLVEAGYAFRYPALEGALRHLLGR
ncbi:MAG TPA: TIGR01777 family oxidoreductase [Gemmatimonadales bacterium]|nr:TIGR01777 family oxidoreductase [Gemmatimonadales bacterium]